MFSFKNNPYKKSPHLFHKCLFLQNNQISMVFEYRFFKRFLEKPPKFNEIDLYFYKPKMWGVGVKARFHREDQLPQKWYINRVELKIMLNLKDINTGKTTIQKWKKISSTKVPTQIYSPKFIKENPAKFNIGEQFTLQDAINKEMIRISDLIADGFSKNRQIQSKHYEKNQDLQQWVKNDVKLSEIFLVEKSRDKSWSNQIGIIRATPFFNITNINAGIFESIAYQSNQIEQVQEILKKQNVEKVENVSYPKLIDKIYFNMI